MQCTLITKCDAMCEDMVSLRSRQDQVDTEVDSLKRDVEAVQQDKYDMIEQNQAMTKTLDQQQRFLGFALLT